MQSICMQTDGSGEQEATWTISLSKHDTGIISILLIYTMQLWIKLLEIVSVKHCRCQNKEMQLIRCIIMALGDSSG